MGSGPGFLVRHGGGLGVPFFSRAFTFPGRGIGTPLFLSRTVLMGTLPRRGIRVAFVHAGPFLDTGPFFNPGPFLNAGTFLHTGSFIPALAIPGFSSIHATLPTGIPRMLNVIGRPGGFRCAGDLAVARGALAIPIGRHGPGVGAPKNGAGGRHS